MRRKKSATSCGYKRDCYLLIVSKAEASVDFVLIASKVLNKFIGLAGNQTGSKW